MLVEFKNLHTYIDKVLDYYIVHDLKLSNIVHYIDDIVILHHDKKYLYECLEKIKEKLLLEYKLEVNEKKTKIVSSLDGFTFFGYRFFIKNSKTIIKIKNDNIKRIKRKVKNLKKLYDNELISYEKLFCSLNTYLYSFKYASNKRLIYFINKCFNLVN